MYKLLLMECCIILSEEHLSIAYNITKENFLLQYEYQIISMVTIQTLYDYFNKDRMCIKSK